MSTSNVGVAVISMVMVMVISNLGSCTATIDATNLFCDPTDCTNSTTSSAYSICKSAVVDGIIPPNLVGPPANVFPTNQSIIDYCFDFCRDGSRQGFGSYEGAVWDVCSGCDTSTTDNICAICSGTTETPGFCRDESTVVTPACSPTSGDPSGTGSEEEVIGRTRNASDCADLVALHRPAADGMAWSSTLTGGYGSCYAEYNPVEIADAGTSTYFSCIFPVSGGGGLVIQGGGSGGSGSGQDKIYDDADSKGGRSNGYSNGGSSSSKGVGGKKGRKGHKGGKKGANLLVVTAFGNAQSVSLLAASAGMIICGTVLFAYKRRNWSRADGVENMNGLREKTPLLDGGEAPPVYSLEYPLTDTKPLLL